MHTHPHTHSSIFLECKQDFKIWLLTIKSGDTHLKRLFYLTVEMHLTVRTVVYYSEPWSHYVSLNTIAFKHCKRHSELYSSVTCLNRNIGNMLETQLANFPKYNYIIGKNLDPF